MPKFGVEVTNIAPAHPSVGKYVSQGIQNTSEAAGIEGLTKLIKGGFEAYDEYKLGQVNEQVQAEISTYAETSPTLLQQDVQKLQKEKSLLSIEDPVELDAFDKRIRERMDRFTSALKQGVQSESQFELNVLTAAREAINSQPHRTREILAEVERVRELSGVGAIIKSDQLLQKSKQDQLNQYEKDLNDRLQKQNVSYTATTSIQEKEQLVEPYEKADREFDVWNRGKQKEEYYISKQAQKFAETRGDGVTFGALNKFGSTVLKLADQAQADPNNYAKISSLVKQEGIKQKLSFVQGIPAQYRNSPEIKTTIDNFNKGVDTYLEIMDNVGSGKNWKEASQNALAIITSTQDKKLRDSVDVSSMDMLIKIRAADPAQLVVSDAMRDALRRDGNTIATAILNGTINSPVLDKNMPKDTNDNVLSSFIYKSVELGKTTGDYTGLNKTLDTYNNKALAIKDPIQKDLFIYKNLEALAKSDFPKADPMTTVQTSKLIETMLSDPSLGLANMVSNMKKYNVKWERSPNGNLIFLGDKATVFQERYGVKINTALSAYAKVTGKPESAIADSFYQKFLGTKPDATKSK